MNRLHSSESVALKVRAEKVKPAFRKDNAQTNRSDNDDAIPLNRIMI
jgi:hypothetical protein